MPPGSGTFWTGFAALESADTCLPEHVDNFLCKICNFKFTHIAFQDNAVLWNRYELSWFRFRFWESFGAVSGSGFGSRQSGFGSRQFKTVFQQQKFFTQQCQKQHYFPESGPLIFEFFFFFVTFYVGSASKSGTVMVPLQLRQKVTVPTVLQISN
jgi:hypothetical protein